MHWQQVSYGYTLVFTPTTPRHAWQPAADVYETPTTISVMVELAGIDPGKIEVSLSERSLMVSGTRPLPDLDGGGIYQAAEIQRGPFRLEIELPARVAAQPREIRCELGLLSIRLAKASE
jgi:HSP20 family molecular chaperone IbpA